MKLYLIYAIVNDRFHAYSKAVVAAEDEETARRTQPDGKSLVRIDEDALGTWVALKYVRARYLREARSGTKPGVILASFIGR